MVSLALRVAGGMAGGGGGGGGEKGQYTAGCQLLRKVSDAKPRETRPQRARIECAQKERGQERKWLTRTQEAGWTSGNMGQGAAYALVSLIPLALAFPNPLQSPCACACASLHPYCRSARRSDRAAARAHLSSSVITGS